MPSSCSLLSPCILNALSSSHDLLYMVNSFFLPSMCKAGEVQNKVPVGVTSVCCQMRSWRPDSNYKDLVKGKGVSLKCLGDQGGEWDWKRLGSLWAARVASILTTGGQFFHSHHGIAFPGFAVAGNRSRAEGQGFQAYCWSCPSWKCCRSACSCMTLGVSSRALFPSVDVRWQLGDRSLQSSGTRVQEAPSLWLPWGQCTDLHQVGVG